MYRPCSNSHSLFRTKDLSVEIETIGERNGNFQKGSKAVTLRYEERTTSRVPRFSVVPVWESLQVLSRLLPGTLSGILLWTLRHLNYPLNPDLNINKTITFNHSE